MKILFVADLHYYDETIFKEQVLSLIGIDLIIYLGDMYHKAIDDLAKAFPDAECWGILGNHDTGYIQQYTHIKNLHMNKLEKEHLRFVGFEGSFRYKNSNYPLYTHEESMKVLDMGLSEFLIGHAGWVYKGDDPHTGFLGFQKYIDAFHPSYFIHGHEHKTQYTKYKKGMFGKTTEIYCVYGFSVFDTNTEIMEAVYKFD